MIWAILTPSYYEPALAVAPAPDSAVVRWIRVPQQVRLGFGSMRSPPLLLPQLHDTEVAVARCDVPVVGNATDGKKHPRRRGGGGGSPVYSRITRR